MHAEQIQLSHHNSKGITCLEENAILKLSTTLITAYERHTHSSTKCISNIHTQAKNNEPKQVCMCELGSLMGFDSTCVAVAVYRVDLGIN